MAARKRSRRLDGTLNRQVHAGDSLRGFDFVEILSISRHAAPRRQQRFQILVPVHFHLSIGRPCWNRFRILPIPLDSHEHLHITAETSRRSNTKFTELKVGRYGYVK